ncbi:hypothetical protein [Pradoshia eiseniae]|nr:hypothetical protein [Pradoshia eiseniae]
MMKAVKYVFLCACFLFVNFPLQADAAQKSEEVKLKSYMIDVTGDGQKDQLTLYGIPFNEKTKYFKEFKLVSINQKGKAVHHVTGGFSPSLLFADINSDRALEVILEIPTGGSAHSCDYYAFNVYNQEIEELPLPKPLNLNGSFKNNYRANFIIPENNQSFVLNLIKHKPVYDKLGLYKKGKLNEPQETLIGEFHSLTAKDVNHDGINELIGKQTISGASVSDVIAEVSSFWNYEQEKWVLKNVLVNSK